MYVMSNRSQFNTSLGIKPKPVKMRPRFLGCAGSSCQCGYKKSLGDGFDWGDVFDSVTQIAKVTIPPLITGGPQVQYQYPAGVTPIIQSPTPSQTAAAIAAAQGQPLNTINIAGINMPSWVPYAGGAALAVALLR